MKFSLIKLSKYFFLQNVFNMFIFHIKYLLSFLCSITLVTTVWYPAQLAVPIHLMLFDYLAVTPLSFQSSPVAWKTLSLSYSAALQFTSTQKLTHTLQTTFPENQVGTICCLDALPNFDSLIQHFGKKLAGDFLFPQLHMLRANPFGERFLQIQRR